MRAKAFQLSPEKKSWPVTSLLFFCVPRRRFGLVTRNLLMKLHAALDMKVGKSGLFIKMSCVMTTGSSAWKGG